MPVNLLTNRGKKFTLKKTFNGGDEFYYVFLTDDITPSADTNIMSDVKEIAAGNGYVKGGIKFTGNTTDFPGLTEDDALDKAILKIRAVDIMANGGPIPKSGDPARYVAITGAGNTVASREIFWILDLGTDRKAVDQQKIEIEAITIELTEVA